MRSQRWGANRSRSGYIKGLNTLMISKVDFQRVSILCIVSSVILFPSRAQYYDYISTMEFMCWKFQVWCVSGFQKRVYQGFRISYFSNVMILFSEDVQWIASALFCFLFFFLVRSLKWVCGGVSAFKRRFIKIFIFLPFYFNAFLSRWNIQWYRHYFSWAEVWSDRSK